MTQPLELAMRAFEPALPLGVAYSGGADSTALLLACARKWPGQVVALHVNHGLQQAAEAFEQHCRATCARLGLPLQVAHVHAQAAAGQSPEDAARIARYKAFEALAQVEYAPGAIQSIALAQHADDQVETILLALSRGAGMAGISGMPAHWHRGALHYHRPFLQVSGSSLRAWLAAQGEAFVEDPTNADTRFTRNHIRAQLLPALEAVFPQFRDTFARSARHAAQAQELLDELAAADWHAVAQPATALPLLKVLRALSPQRRANVLRHWLKKSYGVIPSAAQMQELCSQIEACSTRGHRIAIKVGEGSLERRGAVLAWYNDRLFPSGKQFRE
jgi:tRNA(Ile)-lysidine synthase